MLFCTISTMRRDRALSKSILALCGVISAGCAVITSFGLLYVCGVRLIQIALITPFLVLCNVGTISIFPIMRIFCIYCVVSLIVVFVFQATLFGACITLDGAKQFTSQSSFICIPFRCRRSSRSMKVSESNRSSFVSQYSLWSVFTSGPFITLILLSYIVYLSASITILNNNIELGLQLSSLLPEDSETYAYLRVYEKHFSEYTVPMEVLIDGNLEYSSPTIRHNILRAVNAIENSEYSLKASFWLNDFHNFLRTYAYLRVYEKHFSEYTVPMEVLIDGNLEYSSPTIRHNILRAANAIENSEYSLKASFWLNDFHNFLRKESINSNEARRLLRSDEKRLFYTYLTDVFLRHPAYRYQLRVYPLLYISLIFLHISYIG
uniref:SSD domain-containing protein n=1 Tax=Ascaris lumbricoides TaxID=6252 RepID=A0A0M3IQK3_ASCLU